MALHQNSNENNKHTPKGFTSAPNMGKILRDENGLSTYVPETTLPASLNFVNGAVAPPTEVLNQVYVIVDTGGGTIHPNWDGLVYNNWCRFDGASWIGYTPVNGDICYDSTALKYKIFQTTAWVDFGVSGGGENISNADLTFDSDHYADLNNNSWQLKDSTGANRLLLDVQQGNANGHGIGYGGAAVDGRHTFYNTATSGIQALCNMSFLNGLKLSAGSLQNDYLNFGSAGFILHIKSNVSYGSSIGVYPDITLKTRHSSTGIVFDTNNYVNFKKAGTQHSIIDSSSRWILRGSAVIGAEKISLQDDTLVKGSDTSASTSGFKVLDSTNASLLEVKNNGVINASNLPTSAAGLSSGDIWNNSGVLNIV